MKMHQRFIGDQESSKASVINVFFVVVFFFLSFFFLSVLVHTEKRFLLTELKTRDINFIDFNI